MRSAVRSAIEVIVSDGLTPPVVGVSGGLKTVEIELIDADARKQVKAVSGARAAAALESERLEREAEQGADPLAGAQQGAQAAREALERARRRGAARAAQDARGGEKATK